MSSEAVRAGYKRAEVGVIPEDWDDISLGDKTIKVGSGITPRGGEKRYKSEGLPFIRSQNIGWGILLMDDIVFIDNETHESFKSTEIEKEDIFLNITGASIGRSAIADENVIGGNVNQHVCIIRTKKDQLNPEYLMYFLLSDQGQKQIDSFQAGGNRQGLNFGQIRSFNLSLPPLPEQTAIAAALSDTDALITALERLIAKKRDIKQAAMQELLTGRRRLPGFDGDWTKKKMLEVGITYSGLTGKTKEDFTEGQYPYISFLNVMKNVAIDINMPDHVNIRSNESQNQVKKGDLFFNVSSETPEEVGMCSALLEDLSNVYLNSFCFGFRLFKVHDPNPLFLTYWFRSDSGRNTIYSLAQGSTRYNISKTNLMQLEIPYPPLPEQTAIATILSDMDAGIAELERKRDKVRNIKEGMMQELLTGRIRLI